MATKNISIQTEDEVSFIPGVAAAKMPVDIKQGRDARMDYQDIPIGKLIPYKKKGGSDFSRMDAKKFAQMVESVKEDGILEALTVRHSHDDVYEILSGETRWNAAKSAGLRVVPCRILKECDDDRAARIFSITNLNRRELTVRDRVNGWWHYWEAAKKSPGRKSAEQQLEEDASFLEDEDDRSVADITVRQIQKYHRVHSLEEPMLKRLDAGELTINVAYVLSFLKPEEQIDLCKWGYPVTKNNVEQLRAISQRGEWSKKAVDTVYIIPLNVEKDNMKKSVNLAVRHFRRTMVARVNPAKMDSLSRIMDEALDLYFQKHPEDMAPRGGV